jgi:hypothetical protein
MKTQFILLNFILMLTALSSFGQCEVDFTSPRAVGTFVLNAFKETNVTALKCTFNQGNRDKQGNVKEFMIESIKFTEGVNNITEIRRYDKHNGVVWMLCKLQVVDEEMMVITLSLENGKYLFEDIHSPSVSDYEELELIDIQQE